MYSSRKPCGRRGLLQTGAQICMLKAVGIEFSSFTTWHKVTSRRADDYYPLGYFDAITQHNDEVTELTAATWAISCLQPRKGPGGAALSFSRGGSGLPTAVYLGFAMTGTHCLLTMAMR